jgi:GNAT superfamily N-acetyltransferase
MEMDDILRRAEHLEARAWADLALAASPALRRDLGLSVEPIGPARLISSTRLESMLFNRALGLDSSDPGAVRRAVRHFDGRGIDRYMLHLEPEAEVESELRGYGLERYHRSWDKFLRDATVPPPVIATSLALRRATRADATRCGELVAAVFETGAASAPLWAGVIERPRWHVFVACEGDYPVAVGGLFADGDLGYVAFAVTDPAYRGRGAQGALMVRRIREAADLGCRWLTTETGEPVAGEPSPSRNNMLRCGFELALRRGNYVPIGTSWSQAPRREAR